MYDGNYWHFVDGEPTIWTMGEMVFLIGEEKRVTDAGVHGLAQNNMDIIDVSAISKYMKDGYTFLFEITVNLHEEDKENDGVQEIYLYTTNTISSSSSESTAISLGKLAGVSLKHRGETPADHQISWAVAGEACRSVMYLRYDAGDPNGKTPDDWVRHDITIKVTVLYDNN
jgi:hypothetical protein